MKSKTKLILYLGVFICALFLLSLMQDTFAVYETLSNGTANFAIGNWVIKLNSFDISSGQTVSFTINNFVYSENAHVSNGVIAPGRSGYFDVILDPDGTDVAVRYDITLDMDEDYGNNISYYVVATDGTTVRTGESTYSGVIDLASIEQGDVATLRITVQWINNIIYDESDTNLGLTQNANISIPAEINVVQYLGETLVEYQEEG